MHDRFLLKIDLIRQFKTLDKPTEWADMLIEYIDDQCLADEQVPLVIQKVMMQVAAGCHMARILKFAYFHGLKFSLFDDVLIPRPDTETLVEAVSSAGDEVSIVDWCTGSGCVGVALAKKYPKAKLYMLDKYESPCENAWLNVEQHQLVGRALVMQADFFAPWPFQQVDVIVINPPYLAQDDQHLQHLTQDPLSALVAEHAGMMFYEHLLQVAQSHLRPEGELLIEFGFDQSQAVLDLALAANWQQPVLFSDMAGHNRVLKVRNI